MEPRYIEGLRDCWQNLFAIAMFRYIEVLFHNIFYYISGVKKIVLYTSLYKGSLYRGSTVIIFSNDKTFSVEALIIFAWLQRLVYNRVSR